MAIPINIEELIHGRIVESERIEEQIGLLREYLSPLTRSHQLTLKRNGSSDTQCVYFNQNSIHTDQPTKSNRSPPPQIHVELILRLCAITPHSKQQLAEKLSLHQKHIYSRYIRALLQEGLIKQTNPNPRASNQKYITTHRTWMNLIPMN